MIPMHMAAATPATVVELLHLRARDTPDALAFSVEGEPIAWRALRDDAAWMAGRLAAAGLARGGACAIALPTSLDAIRTVYAALVRGAAPVIIDTTISPARQARRVAAAQATLLVTSRDLAAQLPDTAARVLAIEALASQASDPGGPGDGPAPADTAYLQFTSGSTGEPRAAAVSHVALLASLRGMIERFDLGSHDVMAAWLPLHYSPGLVRYVFGPVAFGCTAHLVRPSALQFRRWLELITRVRATTTSAPDFAFRLAARTVPPGQVDLRSLRLATDGGESVQASTIRLFEERFALDRVVQPAYGLSEATLIVASAAAGDDLVVDETGATSCGPVMPGLQLRLVGRDGQPCVPGVEGEIVVGGDTLFDGYVGDEPATRAVLREGWLYTGDVGVLDEAGRLTPRFRERALIKRAAAGIAPREIEERVEQVDGVSACAAIGLARGGSSTEEIVVVVETGADGTARSALIAARVERAVVDGIGVVPAQVLVVHEQTLPRTGSGKIRHIELKRLVANGAIARAALFSG